MCEIKQLQTDCVARINEYRAGRSFSDGRKSPHGQMGSLRAAPQDFAKCMNEKALSDLYYSVHRGAGCGHFTSSLKCGLNINGGMSENSCCPRSCTTYAGCKQTLMGCLDQMWDEGMIVLNSGSTQWTMETGHYWNMIKESNTIAACGFGFDTNGKFLATQNFY